MGNEIPILGRKLSSRKLWVSLLVQGANVWLVANGHIESEHFVTLTLFTLGAWGLGEANEKIQERR